jgi:predicted Zn-ribbon and HTH transcriptional regulator
MPRPPLEVADLVRLAGRHFIDSSRHWLNRLHLKVLTAIERCRTAALGAHVDECTACGYRAISYNSCRNRHCPRCQANARDRWIEARSRDLLPVPYAHVVFTLPHEFAPLALQNKKVVYDLLFRTSAETLIEVARNPERLGADIGFFSVLHTWNQKLEHHPHVHCVVPAGGLTPDRSKWIASHPKFLLPVAVLKKVFRAKFTEALQEAFRRGKLGFHGTLEPLGRPKVFAELIRQTYRKDWVVYCKRPFGGAEHVLRYLGCYTHRVAISNHRLVSLADGKITFRWRDSAHKNKRRLMTISVEEFLRRFLLHVLPTRFVRIRHFGILSARHRSALLPLCRQLIAENPPPQGPPDARREPAIPYEGLWQCPICRGPMQLLERITPAELRLRSPPPASLVAIA